MYPDCKTTLMQLLTEYQFFKKLSQISNTHKNRNLKYNWTFLDQLLLPYEFDGRDMLRNLLFHFCLLWVIKPSLLWKTSLSHLKVFKNFFSPNFGNFYSFSVYLQCFWGNLHTFQEFFSSVRFRKYNLHAQKQIFPQKWAEKQ